MTAVQQVEQLVRLARELGRQVATGTEAREIYQMGEQYNKPMKPWPGSATRPTASPASSASPSTPDDTSAAGAWHLRVHAPAAPDQENPR